MSTNNVAMGKSRHIHTREYRNFAKNCKKLRFFGENYSTFTFGYAMTYLKS